MTTNLPSTPDDAYFGHAYEAAMASRMVLAQLIDELVQAGALPRAAVERILNDNQSFLDQEVPAGEPSLLREFQQGLGELLAATRLLPPGTPRRASPRSPGRKSRHTAAGADAQRAAADKPAPDPAGGSGKTGM